MLISSFPSALQTSSPCVVACRIISHVSSSRLTSPPFWLGMKKRSGCSTVRHIDVGQHQCGRVSDLRVLECRASGEVEVDSSASDGTAIKSIARANLAIGSPIVIVEAPLMLKTAEPMPMMRPNTGLIKAGDPGRIIDRRPKDVWAVRFAVGAYLIDGKFFEPLLEE